MVGTGPGILKADAFNILPVPFLLQLYLFHRQCIVVVLCRWCWKKHSNYLCKTGMENALVIE